MFKAILLTFFSEKVVALRRLVISLRRGCLQVPGLSTMGVDFCGVDLTGVVIAARPPDEDMLPDVSDGKLRARMRSRSRGGGRQDQGQGLLRTTLVKAAG